MPGSDRQNNSTQLQNDISRHLRSASPAVKRPASDMGAQDREVHTQDVDMEGGSDPSVGSAADPQERGADSATKAKQQDTGSRHNRSNSTLSSPHESDPKAFRQIGMSDDSASTTSDSLFPPASSASTATTSVSADNVSPPISSTPSIDEQVRIVTEMVERPAQDKQKGFVVSTKWLSRVLARSSQRADGKGDKMAIEGEIGLVDNSDLVMITEDSGKFKDERREIFVPLRPGLTKGEELRILPQDAWDLVFRWYGIGDSPIITRYAHNTSDAIDATAEYELYPPIFSLLKVPAAHTIQTQKEKDVRPLRMLASRETLFQEWLKNAKKLANIEMTTKVRIWKVLGGLKSSCASGMLTPAASRSASPAPGADIVASAGDHMLLDVNTFIALHLGDQREILDAKDETTNEKYNGRSLTLGIAGLSRDEVIVLEEQTSNGEWPSESSRLHLTVGKSSLGKSKGTAGSGRSSPAPSGIITRGRRNGRPKGMTGLSNLGNTCYMNSALQCLRSVEELTQYFLHDLHKKDLNTTNVLGYHGQVAIAYANLLKGIYEDGPASFSPSKFKQVIGRHGPSFSGYQQQDSQEFLLFLLDGLQEDLNRIQKKPYIEKPDSTDEMVHDAVALKAFADKNWQDYKARNDSVITDLFAGMYKSTVTCPVCDKVSIIFDPFSNLTLQLPIENNWSKEIIYFPLHRRPLKIDVDIDKHASFRALKEFIAQRMHANPDKLVVAEAYRNKFYKMFDNTTLISEANIQGNDVICVYELDLIPTNYNPNKQKKYASSIFTSSRDPEDELVDINSPAADRLLVPVYHRQVKANNRPGRNFFGEPAYIVIDREDAKSFDRVLKKCLGVAASMTTTDILNEGNDLVNTSSTSAEDSDTNIMTDDGTSSDSNNVQAMSVQGEDGLVDVSMRDTTQTESGTNPAASSSSLHPSLQPGIYIPPQLQNMFTIKVTSTGEGIPTGWNGIGENSEFDLVSSRMPLTNLAHRPARGKGSLAVTNGNTSDASDSDVGDIHHDADVVELDNESESDSNGHSNNQSASDSDLPNATEIFRQPIGSRRTPQTYSRKGRRQQKKAMKAAKSPDAEALIRPGEAIILDWNEGAYDALFSATEIEVNDGELRGSPTWMNIELYPDEQLVKKRAQRQARRKHGITLEDCLNEFGKSETLSENNAWYCPRCKEHRRANKRFELWKVPDILVMHLKRFSSNRNFRDKLDVCVDYPVEGLDVTDRVLGQEGDERQIYDLIAVDNHYGGLGGGHYTAYGKNFYNNSWYEYNDANVTHKSSIPPPIVTSAAYLLFYRRRSDHPLGGPVLMEMLDETNGGAAESEMQTGGSREPSPASGEGRRLGDSSHNGSSSAFTAADLAHHVGDGGSATPITAVALQRHGQRSSPEAIRGGASLAKSVEGPAEGHDPLYDALPEYHEAPADGERTMLDYGNVNFDPDWATRSNPWDHITNAGPSKMMSMSAPPGSANSDAGDAEMGMGDGSSTKVEGGDGGSSPSSLLGHRMQDFSDTEDFMDAEPSVPVHYIRESAPPPDDDDDEVPVAEIPKPEGPEDS